jgi:hypothetical protein
MAYSMFGSEGIWISATEGVCGKVDGRGILFDLDVLFVEKILQSFFAGELTSGADRAILESCPLAGQMKCMFALGRLENVAWSALCISRGAILWGEVEGDWEGDDGD